MAFLDRSCLSLENREKHKHVKLSRSMPLGMLTKLYCERTFKLEQQFLLQMGAVSPEHIMLSPRKQSTLLSRLTQTEQHSLVVCESCHLAEGMVKRLVDVIEKYAKSYNISSHSCHKSNENLQKLLKSTRASSEKDNFFNKNRIIALENNIMQLKKTYLDDEKNTLLQKYNETLRDEKSAALAKLKLASEEVDAKKNEAANWQERWAKDEKVKEVLKEQLTQNTNQLEKLRSELECKVTALREKEIKMVEDNNMLSNELEHLNKTLLKKQRIEEELNEKVGDLQRKLKDMGEREAMLLQYPDLNGNLLTPTCKGDPMEDMKGQLKANKEDDRDGELHDRNPLVNSQWSHLEHSLNKQHKTYNGQGVKTYRENFNVEDDEMKCKGKSHGSQQPGVAPWGHGDQRLYSHLFMALSISMVTSTDRAIVIGWGSWNRLQSTPLNSSPPPIHARW
ncbi:unnamed protein product [Timema podura]|uniref:Uncharacterized protein n=1 Tax=Timema podura TaxID=61482 RepID=A0ABN7NIE8_TIMPD|nr:unnamed protein product [Timema podura]